MCVCFCCLGKVMYIGMQGSEWCILQFLYVSLHGHFNPIWGCTCKPSKLV